MKLPGLLMLAKAFIRGARALEAIDVKLGRIADQLEGKEPPSTPVPVNTDKAFFRPSSNDQYLRIEEIENRLRRQLHRDPTPEEIAHDLDGLEHGPEDLAPATRERLGL